MHPSNTFSFSHQLENGAKLEISLSFKVTRSADGHLQIAIGEPAAESPVAVITPEPAPVSGKRSAKETDVQYLQRLIQMGEAEPRILPRWAAMLTGVSRRKLMDEKKANRIEYVQKGETRAGNAHLITAKEMIKTLERLAREA